MNSELLKLINQNPKLPIVFMVQSDEFGDYSHMLMKNYSSEVETVYIDDEKVYIGEDDAIEHLSDYYSDVEEYKNLSDDGYDIIIRNKVNDLEHYEAIVIWVSM